MPEDPINETLHREFVAACKRVEQLEAELLKRGLAPAASRADQYRSHFENSADAILIIDGETFVDCNQATVDMLRYKTKKQLLSTHPSELSPLVQPDGRSSFEKANEMIEIAFRQGSHRFEWDHKRADGEVFPVEVLLTVVTEGGRTKLHTVWRDITERKQLESQFRQSQKMEAIGKLTGGIAHDFNNLLMVINGNAELLLSEIGEHDQFSELVKQIGWAGGRAADLTRQLLAFSRKQVLKPAVLDLNDVVAKLDGLLGRMIGENIRLVTRSADRPVLFKADPVLIEQVVINLATNARDAMPNGGTLTLQVERRELNDCTPIARLELASGSYARLTVVDTGIGMDDVILDRVFEPFFTTKKTGEGTGLGLSTVHGIIRQSEGQILIRSTPGQGTSVEVWLPTVDETLTEVEEKAENVGGGAETILVVEDEKSVAVLVERILGEEGYKVLVCSDGVEALKLLKSTEEHISLVLSDVVMPNMGGPEMVGKMRELGMTPIFIFASGYTNDSLPAMDMLGFKANFLQKPYDRRTLLECVRNALDRKTSS